MEPTEEALNYAESKNKGTDKKRLKEPEDKFKKLDYTTFLFCFSGLLIATILNILFAPIGGTMNIFLLIFISFIAIFSLTYIGLYLLFAIFSLIFKKFKENYYQKYTIKLIISSAATIVIIILLVFGHLNLFDGRTFDPTNSTNNLLKSQIDNPGAESCTEKVTFKPNSSMYVSEITQDIGLDASQVWLLPNNISGFKKEDDHKTLIYDSNIKKTVVMCIICSNAQDLNEAINNNLGDSYFGVVEFGESYSEMVCIIYPKLP